MLDPVTIQFLAVATALLAALTLLVVGRRPQ